MINYQITLDSNNHLYLIQMTFRPVQTSHEIKLPTWIPGSYMIREFSRNIVKLSVKQSKNIVSYTQINKNTWKISKLKLNQDVVINYQVYAYDVGIRGAYLDNLRAYFNNTSLCLYIVGLEALKHQIILINLPKTFDIATGLKALPNKQFLAQNYDELIDCPFEIGKLIRLKFNVKGITHYLILSGIVAKNFDKARLLSDITKICNTQINLFGGKAPFETYTFLLNLSGDIFTGLEHRNSTALLAPSYSLPIKEIASSTDYIKLLALISHEYFHTWNVKRIKPAIFSPYDLENENYTKLLWWFEGITSYYDDLILYRSGLIDQKSYLEIVLNNINGVYKYTGAQIQSVANSSLTSWIKYYRQDENSPNSIVSYYTKGAIIGLCLDLYIRKTSGGVKSLDDVLLKLYKKWQKDGLGIKEDELSSLISKFSGCDLKSELDLWVDGLEILPFEKLLANMGIQLINDSSSYTENGKVLNVIDTLNKKAKIVDLGCSLIKDNNTFGYKIKHVYSDSASAKGGLSANDHLLAIDGEMVTDITKHLARYKVGDSILVTIFRREVLLTLKIKLTKPNSSIYSLIIKDFKKLKIWL